MKTKEKGPLSTFKCAHPHPSKFACQSYQNPYEKLFFSVDPVLPPIRPRSHVIKPPRNKGPHLPYKSSCPTATIVPATTTTTTTSATTTATNNNIHNNNHRNEDVSLCT